MTDKNIQEDYGDTHKRHTLNLANNSNFYIMEESQHQNQNVNTSVDELQMDQQQMQ